MGAIATFRLLAADTLDKAVESVWDTVDLSGFNGAITLYAASESTGKGAWGKLAEAVEACIREGDTLESVRAKISMAEDDYKRTNGVTVLPKAWTSAKAVALKAVENGVPLRDEDGELMGKSAVEREYKGKGEKTDYEKACEAANRLVKLFGMLTDTEADAIAVTLATAGYRLPA